MDTFKSLIPEANITYPLSHSFDFKSLHNVTDQILNFCSSISTDQGTFCVCLTAYGVSCATKTLTFDQCTAYAGKGWTKYLFKDIYKRLAAWKIPLFMLIFQFCRPPLGFAVDIFVISHILGDPIDTIASLLYTLAECQSWVKVFREGGEHFWPNRISIWQHEPSRDWKVLALVMTSYDECGQRRQGKHVLSSVYAILEQGNIAHCQFLERSLQFTANALASDRHTQLLPVIFAQLSFVLSYATALVKTASSWPSDDNWVNIEVHSIAFSLLYSPIVTAVFLSSVIGSSQTEYQIPRILHLFEERIRAIRDDITGDDHSAIDFPKPLETSSGLNYVADELPSWYTDCQPAKFRQRRSTGGIPSWRPTKWIPRFSLLRTASGPRRSLKLSLLAFLFVALSAASSIYLSARVPPSNFSCRHAAELAMFSLWVLSFFLETAFVLFSETFGGLDRAHFSIIFWKNMLFGGANIALMLVVQMGIFNRCECWTNWGREPLTLPFGDTAKVLMSRIVSVYPIGVSIGFASQFVLCAVVAWRYRFALRVYLQRDDGKSNVDGISRRFGSS